jgi:phage/plasmid-like protein (TIGR03299 family)
MTGPIYGGIPGDIAESKQDVGELNLWTLIGCTDERGDAWHRRDDLQGAEDNHYPGFIPEADVMRRLFYWAPQRLAVAYLRPCSAEEADFIGSDGRPMQVIESQQGRVGVIREDTDYDMGVFKSGANHPPYSVTLIREAQRLTGSTLGISTAGLVQKGSRAWVEFSMQETLHDAKSGFDYRPNLLKADSMDGSISLTTAMTIEATVCNNTLTWNLLEARESGRLFRRKHTQGIVSGDLSDERQALGVLERVDSEFTAELHSLLDTPVSEKQKIEVMDILAPIPAEKGRGRTMAENRRDQLLALDSDLMVSPWVGTAFGEVQRYNTEQHWLRGNGGTERNIWRAITGKTAEADREVVKALEKVLA